MLNDGYVDGAVEMLNDHKPAGPLRGGKYSSFEAGSRIPMLVCWEGKIKPGVSRAVVSQVDFLATFAALTNQSLLPSQAIDSYNMLSTLQGLNKKGRHQVAIQSFKGLNDLLMDMRLSNRMESGALWELMVRLLHRLRLTN